MTDIVKTNLNGKNEKLLVFEKVIPKIAKSLHSVIIKSKDKDFQERCMERVKVSHFDDLPSKFESNLWVIAKLKLGVLRSGVEDGSTDNQVVPQCAINRDSHQKTAISVRTELQVSKPKNPTHHENSYNGLLPFEMNNNSDTSGNLNCAQDKGTSGSKSVSQNALGNNSSQSVKVEIPLESGHQPEVIYVDDNDHDDLTASSHSKDDWLDDFTQDFYWMNEASCDSSLQDMSTSFTQLDHSSRNPCLDGEVAEDMSFTDTADPELYKSFYKKNGTGKLNSNTYKAEYNRRSNGVSDSDALKEIEDNTGTDSGNNFECLGVHHNKLVSHNDWMSFQERNTLIDEFEALADFFDD